MTRPQRVISASCSSHQHGCGAGTLSTLPRGSKPMTFKTRLAHLEHAITGKGNLMICHRQGAGDDPYIAALRAEAKTTGSLLVIINSFSRLQGLEGATDAPPPATT